MKSNRKSTPCMLRLEDGVIEKMDSICHLAGCSRVELVEGLLLAEYERINGNPQLRVLMEQLKGVADTLRQMSAIDADAPQ